MVDLDIIQLSRNPQFLREVDIEQLHDLAQKNSQSQAVQLVYTMRLKQTNDFRYEQQLNRLALLTDDRSKLYHLFENNKDLEPLEIESPEEQLVENLDVVQDEPIVKEEPSGDTIPDKEEVLSPQERVQKILEESRKRREEFQAIKESPTPDKVAPQEKVQGPVEEKIVPEHSPIEPMDFSLDHQIEKDHAPIIQEPIEAPKEREIEHSPFQSEPTEIENAPVFSIDEETLTEQHSYSEWLKIIQSNLGIQKSSIESGFPAHRVASTELETTTFDLIEDEVPERIIGEPLAVREPIKEKMELLDSFMHKLPDLKKRKTAGSSITNLDVGEISKGHDSLMVTETLANIYLEQQHFDKAIKAYEIMKLKYPEKSGFFASRISDIRKLINSNK